MTNLELKSANLEKREKWLSCCPVDFVSIFYYILFGEGLKGLTLFQMVGPMLVSDITWANVGLSEFVEVVIGVGPKPIQEI